MKNLLFILVLLAFSTSLFGQEIGNAPNNFTTGITITCHVTGYASDDGQTRAGLYNSPETWIKTEFGKYTTVIHNNKATIIFHNVPPGEYGVSLYHDANKNNDFDRTWGIPTEDYAVSNNAKRMLSAPKWEEAKFKVGTVDMEIYFSF